MRRGRRKPYGLSERKTLEVTFQGDYGVEDNYTVVYFDDANNKDLRYIWFVRVTPNMSKVPAFFNNYYRVGDKLTLTANIKGSDDVGRLHLYNVRVLKNKN